MNGSFDTDYTLQTCIYTPMETAGLYGHWQNVCEQLRHHLDGMKIIPRIFFQKYLWNGSVVFFPPRPILRRPGHFFWGPDHHRLRLFLSYFLSDDATVFNGTLSGRLRGVGIKGLISARGTHVGVAVGWWSVLHGHCNAKVKAQIICTRYDPKKRQ